MRLFACLQFGNYLTANALYRLSSTSKALQLVQLLLALSWSYYTNEAIASAALLPV